MERYWNDTFRFCLWCLVANRQTSKKNYFTIFKLCQLDPRVCLWLAICWVPSSITIQIYRVRKIYTTHGTVAVIYKHPHQDTYLSTLHFGRLCKAASCCSNTHGSIDVLFGFWHTLLLAVFAMMFSMQERTGAPALSGLSLPSLSASLHSSPPERSMIGIRWGRGTTFHPWRFLSGICHWVPATVGGSYYVLPPMGLHKFWEPHPRCTFQTCNQPLLLPLHASIVTFL